MRVLWLSLVSLLFSITFSTVVHAQAPAPVGSPVAVATPLASAEKPRRAAPTVQEQLLSLQRIEAQATLSIANVFTLWTLGVGAFGSALVLVLVFAAVAVPGITDEQFDKFSRGVFLLLTFGGAVAGYQIGDLPAAFACGIGAAAAIPSLFFVEELGNRFVRKA